MGSQGKSRRRGRGGQAWQGTSVPWGRWKSSNLQWFIKMKSRPRDLWGRECGLPSPRGEKQEGGCSHPPSPSPLRPRLHSPGASEAQGTWGSTSGSSWGSSVGRLEHCFCVENPRVLGLALQHVRHTAQGQRALWQASQRRSPAGIPRSHLGSLPHSPLEPTVALEEGTFSSAPGGPKARPHHPRPSPTLR